MMVSGTTPLSFFLGPMHLFALQAGTLSLFPPHFQRIPHSSAPRGAEPCSDLSSLGKATQNRARGPTSPREMQRLQNLSLSATYHVGEAGELGELESSSERGLLMPGED